MQGKESSYYYQRNTIRMRRGAGSSVGGHRVSESLSTVVRRDE